MSRRAAPHRGTDVHYGGEPEALADDALPADAGPAVNPFDIRPSKTRLKQKSHALQALGVQLTELSAERLDRIELPDSLRDALEDYRRTKSFEGKRRQLQYIGKLMHNADEAALREAVAEATLGSAQNTLALHQAEQWRLALITDDEAMTRWLHEHPETDTQQLRSLVRAARRDAAGLKPEDRQPRSFRELFQFLRPLLAS
jgi:ribosome-associated protein